MADKTAKNKNEETTSLEDILNRNLTGRDRDEAYRILYGGSVE
jgi:hypothetical protein